MLNECRIRIRTGIDHAASRQCRGWRERCAAFFRQAGFRFWRIIPGCCFAAILAIATPNRCTVGLGVVQGVSRMAVAERSVKSWNKGQKGGGGVGVVHVEIHPLHGNPSGVLGVLRTREGFISRTPATSCVPCIAYSMRAIRDTPWVGGVRCLLV